MLGALALGIDLVGPPSQTSHTPMMSTSLPSFFMSSRWPMCAWARPPGPRIAKLSRSLAPFTAPMAGWANTPVAAAAPVASPAVWRKPRRVTAFFSVMVVSPCV